MSKKQKIEELQQRLANLKEQKDKLLSEADSLAEKRNKLNERHKILRAEIFELKSKRDEANQKVKELKKARSDTNAKAHEKVEKLKELNQEAKTVLTKIPARSHQDLQRQLENLEWKIQTTSLNLQDEKELVGQVKQVEVQLNIYRKLQQISQRVNEQRTGLKALNTEAKLCHERLTRIAQQGQEIHQKMLTKIEEAKKIRSNADSLHQTLVQTLERLKPIRHEMDEILNEIRKLRGEVREGKEREKRNLEEALRDELEKRAREKLKRGEKLDWEEFQLLAEKGMGAQD